MKKVAPGRLSACWARLHRWGHWQALLATVGTSILPTGCTPLSEYVHNGFKVGPNYHRPPAPVAQTWIDADDPRVHTDPPIECDWWKVFNDPALCRAGRSGISAKLDAARSRLPGPGGACPALHLRWQHLPATAASGCQLHPQGPQRNGCQPSIHPAALVQRLRSWLQPVLGARHLGQAAPERRGDQRRDECHHRGLRCGPGHIDRRRGQGLHRDPHRAGGDRLHQDQRRIAEKDAGNRQAAGSRAVRSASSI